MASFIIPSGILGLISPRTIYLDNGVTMQNTMPKRVAKFGDGYSLSIPLGPAMRTMSVSFSGRPIEEINLIEDYFRYLGSNRIGNLTVFGESINAIVSNYSKSFINNTLYSLNSEFREVFREEY